MTLDIQPAGSVIQVPRYAWERRPGLSGAVMRLLGLARPRRRLERIDEIPCPFAHALVSIAEAESSLDELTRLRPDSAPILLGTPETAASMLDLSERAPVEGLLSELSRLDVDRWLAERV